MGMRADPAESMPLDERLCLALYRASRAMTARYRPPLSALGLTYPQYLVMMLLWEEGPSSVGQIGARLDLESSTLSPLLKRLQVMGFIVRARDEHDERSVIVSLTDHGAGLQARAAGVAVEMCVAVGMAPAQQAALVAELGELALRLQAATPATTGSSTVAD